MIAAVTVMFVPSPAAQAAGTTVVDPNTTNAWTQYTRPDGNPSTQNVGRIWTDKSVFTEDYTFDGEASSLGGQQIGKGDSDFLVGLSALSSTSNLKTTTTTSQPLDIVLVLDDSGSMAYDIDYEGNRYKDVYTPIPADQVVESHGHSYDNGWWTEYSQDTRGGTYYIQNERGDYSRVNEETERYGNRYNGYDEHIRWTVNGQEVDPETTQFYTYERYDLGERRGALQYAVNNFIDQTAAMNAQIADQDDKIRLSIVVFEDNASTENHLTVCEGENVSVLKETVNDLRANGATNAGAGMTNANTELRNNSNRPNTKQVVIFFTDGVPTTSSSFSESVANTAVDQSKQIKNRGGSVYSIGIFDGANPNETEVRYESAGWGQQRPVESSQANVFMNAVSSNYPNPTAWDELGRRATGDPDFYKSADNASSLNEVFQDIFDESTENAGSGSPIVDESQEGNTDPGDLTFSDVLGSYMEVTGIDGGGLGNPNVMKVAYADRIITSDRRTEERDEQNGVTAYTYHFSGTVGGNAVYGEADLADLKVTVKHYDDPAKGDEVTATIPADLLPMRNYDVDTNAGTMTVTPAYPIRLFYGVSLKQDAEDAIEAGSGDVYDAILATNKSADGTNAEFLTNQWTKNNAQGDTTASFIPNAGNKFYYYTSNTPLYIDNQCTTRATRSNIDEAKGTLYYSEPYWVQGEGNAASQVTTGIALDLNGADWNSAEYQNGQGYYIPAGTQRLDRPATLNSGKNEAEGGNRTATASSVLTPAWEGAGVSQHLGNNGKMTFPLPGQLEIKKNVYWGNASDETKANQNSFEFTVDFNGADTLAGEYDYDVFGQGEDPVRNGRVSDGDAIKLAANQRAVIYGLSNGTTFTVTETGANQNGFTTTDQSADPNNVTNDGVTAGTIVGGSQQSVVFQNNYRADKPLTVDMASYLKVKKDLRDRDWRDTDEFTFDVQSVDMGSGVVAPTNSSVTITEATKDQAVSFGDIKFTTTGTFRYIVTENNEDQIVGIDYSSASYRLEITIGDAGNGNLQVDSYKLERLQNDEGSMTPGQTETVQGDTVTFVNTYMPDAAPVNIDGYKNYTDKSGDNPTVNNKFQFQMEALGDYVTGTGSRDDLTISADDTPKPTQNTQGNVTTIGNEGGEFHMPTISYTGDHVGNTYVYKITEVQGTENGMTYDQTSYEVEVTVTEEAEPTGEEGQAHIKVSVNKTPQDLTFTNTYDPTDVTLGADGVAPIKGTKTLNGREMQEGETFYFQLTALNDAAKIVLPDTKTVTVDDPNGMDFDFGELTFSKAGQYTFQVNEVADGQGAKTTDGDGMTFDTNLATVTVDVTLNKGKGKLEAKISYVNDKHTGVTDHAQFTNVYEANMNYGANGAGGINVTKTMFDRSMAANDYTFTITGEGAAAGLVAEGDKSFGNTAAQANGTVTMAKLQGLTFDQTDAGKTYTFVVDELLPAEDDRIAGVEYDQSEYRVDIAVYDNHDGTMHTVTTVTRTKDAAGTEVDEQIDEWNSDVDKGQVPTIDFTNTYKPTPAELTSDAGTGLRVKKVVAGAPSPEGVEYGFTLTAKDTVEGPIANIGGLTDGKLTTHTTGVINADGEDGTDDDAQTVPFAGTLTFSKPGTYTFTVQEDVPAADEGWSFGTDPKTVTVVVSDRNTQGQYDGALHIVRVTNDGLVTIENSYEPGAVVVGGDGADQQITVQKSVTGADSTADFTFAIEPVIDDDHTNEWWRDRVSVADGSTPETTISGVTQAQAKTATFDAITFKTEGEYQFKITEKGAAEFNAGDNRNGWTYDEHASYATVTVTDTDHDGFLEASVSYNNDDATADADEAVDYAAAFTNAYTTTPAELTKDADSGIGVQKHVEGAPNSTNFTFTATFNADASVKRAADAGLAAGEVSNIEGLTDGKLSVTISDDFNADDTKAVDFDTIKLSKPGVYVFDVTEDNAKSEAPDGWTYDTAIRQIVVTVTDNGQGKLVASVEDNDPLFTNSYQAGSVALDGDSQLKATKKVTGAPALSDFEFTMKLTEGDPTGVTGIGEDGITKSTSGLTGKEGNEAVQTVEFGTLTFTKAGTYEFQVVENTTTDAAGWTYASGEDNAKTITVTVTDDQFGGQLEATTEVDGNDTNNPTFTNSYKAGSITTGEDGLDKLQVTKAVTGAPATEEFGFELTPAEDYGDKVAGLNDGKLAVSTTDLKGQEDSRTLTFGDLTFTEEGTSVFNVKETNADPAEGSGWTYDNDDAKQITVVVTDENHDGKLDATTTVEGEDTNNPTFTNAYVPAEVTTDADADTAIQVTKKVTGHDAIEAFEFSLSLKDGQNAGAVFEGKGEDKTTFDGMTVTTSKDIKAGKTEAKTFGDITFTEAGDYVFVIDETTTTTAGGWTYDGSTHEVTVHVKDNSEGELYIDGIDGNKPTFENVYKLQPAMFRAARFQLQGNKVLDGRNWETGDEFTFTLTAGRGDNVDGSQMSEDEVAATMPDSTSDTIRPADGDGSKVTDNSAQFTFTDERFPGEDIVGNVDDVFTYTKPGTYRYLIRETNPNVSNPGSGILGVSYDQTVYRLTVKVTDNGDGTMNAEGSYTRRNADGTWADLTGSNEVTFTNKYSSDEIDVTFNAFKVLEDRDQNMEDGEFTFHMEFAGWAANDANADPSDDSAWTMDDTTKAPEAAEDTGNIIRGDVTFGEMAFTKDNVGYTYRYKITEVEGNVPGVTYDTTAHYVTAKVTSEQQANADGTYTEHVRVETSGEAEWNEQTGTAPTSGAIFTNTYEAGAATGVPANFQLTKQFTGHEWTDDYGFEFTLAAQDSELADGTPVDAADVPMPASATKTVNAPDKEGGDTATFDFGGISYDKAGTYRYTVTETHAGETLDGITYDAQPAQVTVTVTEGKDSTGALTGQLVATATVTNGDFVNTYETSAVYNANGVGGLDITKQVTNHVMTDGQFSFTITATGDNADAAAKKLGIEDGATTTVESAQAAAGVATSVKNNPFETVVFDKSDDGVTYTYTIKENGKTGEGDYKNYVLDTNTYTVEITPTDNGDGTMTVKTVVDGTETTNQRTTVAFVNSYQADPTTVGAEGAATIEGTKTLKNDILADGQFTFQVKSGDVVVATGTNAANGTITFDDITYTTENLAAAATVDGSDEVGKATVQTTDAGTVYTFNYTVSEVEPAADSGVTASTAAQNITVTVTDDGNGTLTPQVTYGDGDPLAFENVYGGDAEFSLDIAGTKEIVGAQDGLNVPVLEAGDYEFTIVGNPAQDGTPAPMPAVATVANDASGNVTFEDIVYTMENTFGSAPATGIATLTAGRTQVFTYTISESGTVAGVTNEQGTKTVEVTVTDLGGGKLEAEVTSVKTDEGADFAFTNVYDVNPTTSSLTGKGGFTITKKLTSDTGRKLAENEFTFQLKSGDTVVATATNAADGTVSFDGITFTKPGTYNYVLSEVNDGKPGVDYDATSYNVTATAEDQGNGTLTVTWDMLQAVDDAVTFTNVYDPADATVTLGAGKTFAGADLKDGQFTFQLTGADESTPMPEGAKDGVSTATNDENGSIVFGTIAYGKPGTYKYTVSEVNDEQDGVTYDDTTYEVTVTVTDDTAAGTLKAAVSYGDADAMVFSNQYKKPVEPAKPTIPKTGIDVIIPGVAGLILLLGAGGVYAFKRRKRS